MKTSLFVLCMLISSAVLVLGYPSRIGSISTIEILLSPQAKRELGMKGIDGARKLMEQTSCRNGIVYFIINLETGNLVVQLDCEDKDEAETAL